jgi:hypothetical protein
MNNDEAKFILGVYRPDGRDAADPAFAESLAQAQHDPVLGAWLRREQALDEAFSAKLAEFPVPDLRKQILAGAHASRRRRAWGRGAVWLAAAAAAAVLIGTAVRLGRGSSGPGPEELAAFARHDLAADASEHLGAVPGLADLQRHLADPSTRLGAGLNLDLAALRQHGCRVIKVSGRDVYELCFVRDGQFHLYVASVADFEAARPGAAPELTSQGALTSATWADARYVYVAVTDAGPDALRRVL